MNPNQNPFERLRLLFSDVPEILRLLDPLMLDFKKAEDETTSSAVRQDKIFTTSVNLYVTGKSKVGKSTLGNKLFDNNLLPTTGFVDCTDALYLARIGRFLYYFDLPGAGSDEDFEDINRAILMLPSKNPPERFRFVDEEKKKEEVIEVRDWEYSQQEYLPHVCIYMLAQHRSIFRKDQRYLDALLGSFRERFGPRNRVVFVINIHTYNGVPAATKDAIDNVTAEVTRAFRAHYPEERLPLVTINALEMNGFSELTNEICQVLELSKIQTFYSQVLPELKKRSGQIRESRFLSLLCYLAARLSVRKADASMAERSLLYEAYMSIYLYGFTVYAGEVINYDGLEEEVSSTSASDIAGKTEDVKQQVAETKLTDIKQTIKVEEFEYVPGTDYREVTNLVYKQVPRSPILGTGFRDAFWPKYEYVPVTDLRAFEVIRKKSKGFREEHITVATVEEVVGYREEVVGQKVLTGGFEFVKGIFALGLGVNETLNKPVPPAGEQFDFKQLVENGKPLAARLLDPHKLEFDFIFSNKASARDAEEAVRALLLNLVKSIG